MQQKLLYATLLRRMPDARERKPSAGLIALLVVATLATSALTCWLVGINPLPTAGHWSKDPGWFLTIALVYFFVLYFAVDRRRRRRRLLPTCRALPPVVCWIDIELLAPALHRAALDAQHSRGAGPDAG